MIIGKARRRPDLLANRIPHDAEEFLALHFPAGSSRDAARRLWKLLEEAFALDLRGLHPDDDLGELLSRSNGRSVARPLGSFRRLVEHVERSVDSLGEIELVMGLEEELNQRGFTLLVRR